jgi:hypothetical protein
MGEKYNENNLQSIRSLMQELPFYNTNLIPSYNSLNSNCLTLPTMKQLNKYPSMCDLGLFNLDTASDVNMDANLTQQSLRTQYYSPYKFAEVANKKPHTKYSTNKDFSMLHNNVRSLKRNLENLQHIYFKNLIITLM